MIGLSSSIGFAGSPAAVAQSVQTGRIVLLIGLAIVALILFGVVALALRRRLFASEVDEGEAFDMESLQRQHKAGLISENEFKTLRRALLGLPPEESASSAPPPGDSSHSPPKDDPGKPGESEL